MPKTYKISKKLLKFINDLVNYTNNEIGINFYIPSKGSKINQAVFIKGSESSVSSVGYAVVKGHTHPYSLYNGYLPYQPPTTTDFIQSIWDFISGTQVNILFESKGSWKFSLTSHFRKLIYQMDPDLKKQHHPLQQGENNRGIMVDSKISEMIKYIKEESDALLYEFLVKQSISLDDYIEQMEYILGDDKVFNINFIPYMVSPQIKINNSELSNTINDNVLECQLIPYFILDNHISYFIDLIDNSENNYCIKMY